MSGKRRKTARRRQGGKGKPFVKGDPRANKDGRPPLSLEDREFKALCRAKAPESVERIEKIARGKGMTAFKANEYLVDRGYGKPKQEIDLGARGGAGGLIICLPPENPDG